MKQVKIVIISLLTIVFVSCFGDKKTAIGETFDTDDFENKNFTGNTIDFKDLPENLCSYVNTNTVLEAYKTYGVTKVTFDNKRRFMGKYCNFGIIFDNTPSKYSLGFLSIIETPETPDTNWKETWEFKKKMKQSAQYVSGLGQAAIWYGKQHKLEIKMEGYTMALTVPAVFSNTNEAPLIDDYKKIAIAIAKNTNLL